MRREDQRGGNGSVPGTRRKAVPIARASGPAEYTAGQQELPVRLMVNALECGSPALLMKLACLLLPRICCQKGPTLHFTYSSIARYPPAREEGASGRFFSGASSVIRNDQHPIMLSRSTFKPPIVLKGMKNTLT